MLVITGSCTYDDPLPISLHGYFLYVILSNQSIYVTVVKFIRGNPSFRWFFFLFFLMQLQNCLNCLLYYVGIIVTFPHLLEKSFKSGKVYVWMLCLIYGVYNLTLYIYIYNFVAFG